MACQPVKGYLIIRITFIVCLYKYFCVVVSLELFLTVLLNTNNFQTDIFESRHKIIRDELTC